MAFGEECGSTSSSWRYRLKTRRNFLRCAIGAEPPVYLEVLTNETNYFSAELDMIRTMTRVKRIPLLALFFVSAMESPAKASPIPSASYCCQPPPRFLQMRTKATSSFDCASASSSQNSANHR